LLLDSAVNARVARITVQSISQVDKQYTLPLRTLYHASQVRASFTMENDRLRLNFDIQNENDRRTVAPPAPPAVPPASITTALSYMSMSDSQKRATLRSTGVQPPRRRSASSERLDALLLPLLDEVVRREVLLRQALERGDYTAAQQLAGGRSERSVLQSAVASALEEGDTPAVQRLKARLDVLTERRADITQVRVLLLLLHLC
jgi:hypothetical protein